MKQLFVLAIILATQSDIFSQNENIKNKIYQFLDGDTIILIKKQPATFKLPLIEYSDDVFIVRKEIALPIQVKDSLVEIDITFSLEGDFILLESVKKDTAPDPWRRTVAEYEAQLSSNNKVNGIGRIEQNVTLDSIFATVCSYYWLNQATEFSISLLDFKFYHKQESVNIFMLKAWGLKNPMPITRAMPEREVNRVRAFFYTNGKRIGQNNFL